MRVGSCRNRHRLHAARSLALLVAAYVLAPSNTHRVAGLDSELTSLY